MMILALVLQVAPASNDFLELRETVSAEVVSPSVANDVVPLWRTLSIGLSPEEVAQAIGDMDGIKQAVVKRSRKGKLKELDIDYLPAGILIGEMKFTVLPTFVDDKLTEVVLSNNSCASASLEQMKLLSSSLKEKFGNQQQETIVDDDGVKIDERVAFWSDLTRVRLAYLVKRPSLEYVSSNGRGIGGALAQLANVASKASYDEALEACPIDRGVTVTTTITYLSQAAFQQENARDVAKRSAKRQATKDGL